MLLQSCLLYLMNLLGRRIWKWSYKCANLGLKRGSQEPLGLQSGLEPSGFMAGLTQR